MTSYRLVVDPPDGGDDPELGSPARDQDSWYLTFDYHLGSQIVTDVDRWAVTDALRTELEERGVHGVSFRPMQVAKGRQYAQAYPDATLPTFWELIPAASATDGDAWVGGDGDLHVKSTFALALRTLPLGTTEIHPE